MNKEIKPQHILLQSIPLILFSLTLRPFISAVGPVLPEIRSELGASATQAGILTVVPVLCFATGAFLAPRILRLISPNTSVAISLLLLSIGGFSRLISNFSLLLLGTIICGLGAALGNIVGTLVARRDFSRRLGLVMGLYVGGISASAALAGLIGYPISKHFGSWKYSLGFWAVFSLLVLGIWLLMQRGHSSNESMPSARSYRYLIRNPAAWWLAIYFGFQSTNFHSLAGWLPSILRDSGISATSAGSMTSLMILVGVPTGLIIPIFAARNQSQRFLVTLIVATTLVGLFGVLISPTSLPWLWVFLIGAGIGSSFPLALTITITKSNSPETARDLTSFMQSWGYLISAVGPITLGALRDAFGSWEVALVALIIGTLVQLAAGLIIGGPKDIHVEESKK